MMRISSSTVWIVATLLSAHGTGVPDAAAGGPENVLVVVNSNSEDSRVIANHYIRWRNIPSSNVVYIPWRPLPHNCSGKQFREEILSPMLSAIRRRKLEHQIDYIAYSSDFAWRVDMRGDLPNDRGKLHQPIASLTGATCLWRFVENKSPSLVALNSNFYAADGARSGVGDYAPSRAFRGRYMWDANGKRVTSGGQQYFLSTMLAVTAGRGNTRLQALDYLKQSATIDATHPRGTVYFVENSDIRSRVRHNLYDGAAAALNRMGRTAKVLEGVLPDRKVDIFGLMTGTRTFDLAASGCKIVPGALCEHLTSYGGVLRTNSPHTPFTKFLAAGASGASGTVVEPLAAQPKFPRPELHVHYARGANLAESFFQSVSAPYQLLIVGDPLCAPLATLPRVEVGNVQAGDVVSGNILLKPEATAPQGIDTERFELYVDGRLVSHTEPSRDISFDTTTIADGYHELRVVAVDDSPLEFAGRLILPIWVDNHGGEITLEAVGSTAVKSTDEIRLRASSRQAQTIVLFQHQKSVGRLTGDSGEFRVQANSLGSGPIVLRAVAFAEKAVFSKPIWLTIHDN